MRLKRRAEQSTLWQEVRPVSPPRWQDDGKEVLTCDGSGLSFSACAGRLVPAGSWQRTLSESLASSLRDSTGYAVSLKLKATKSGRSLLVPTMLERPTEGSESGSWATPQAHDSEGTGRSEASAVKKSSRCLQREVRLTDAANGLWASPQARDWKGELLLGGQVRQWPTARAEDSESAGAHVARGTAETLTAAARLSAWPTARSTDAKDSARTTTRNGSDKRGDTATLLDAARLTDAANGLWAGKGVQVNPNNDWLTPTWKDGIRPSPTNKNGSLTLYGQLGLGRAGLLDQDSPSTSGKRRGSRGGLNPDWVAQLLGFPDGWLCPPSGLSDEWLFPATAARRSKPSETPSSRNVRGLSAKRSSKRKRG